MILTVDKKKKFLVTMIIIMACATAINYGLYNVLNTYFHKDDNSIYSGVQFNIIIVLVVIAFATVIMVVLIPAESVKEVKAKIENNGGSSTVLTGGLGATASGPLGTEEYDERTDEEKLSDMIDEDLGDKK